MLPTARICPGKRLAAGALPQTPSGGLIRGVARILVWEGINFYDLVSMAVISLLHHDIPPHVVRALKRPNF